MTERAFWESHGEPRMKKEEALQIEQKKPEEALGQVYWEWDRAGGEEEGHFPVSED